MKEQHMFNKCRRYLGQYHFVDPLLLWTGILIVAATAIFITSAGAELPPCEVPIPRSDVRNITSAIHEVTNKPILAIMGITSTVYVPGAVSSKEYILDIKTGKRSSHSRYIRTDRVSVYMQYTDPSRVDVYLVQKVRGRWKIESKKDWFL